MNRNIHELGANAYRAARRTQTPLRVIVELYDAMLCSVAHAKAAKLEGRPETEVHAVERVTKIIQSLDSVLNEEPRAKPVVEPLHAYYKTTMTQLHRAKQAKSPEAETRYGSVQRQILAMREAFAAVAGVPSLVARRAEKSA